MSTRTKALWGGAIVASALVVSAIAVAPLGIADQAAEEKVDAAAILEEAAIIPSEDWAETYPNEYATWLANEDNTDGVDYNEEYPYLATIYAGNAFSKDYLQARGHNYTVTDASGTERPHALANCLSCKSSQMNALIASDEVGVYTLPFEEVAELATEAVGCYTCHENTGNELVVTNIFMTAGLGEDADDVSMANQVCGQCHNEYYFDPATKATTLPYDSVEAMSPEAILAYYDEIGFSDYTDPLTGVAHVKVQHPEIETILGEGYKMMNYDCADCHMGTVEAEDGTEYANHYLVSPLENETLLANDCSRCHEDLAAEVEAIQTAVEERTNEIGYKLEELAVTLGAAVEAGTLSEDEYAQIAQLNREAVFYWDFVFVENSEGAHNSALTHDCLDKAEAAADAALEMLA